MELKKNDHKQIEEHQLSVEDVKKQLQNFKNGFSSVKLIRPATLNDGIEKFSSEEIEDFKRIHRTYTGTMIKFVPASGAASRMFRFLYEIMNSDDSALSEEGKLFFQNIKKFAFYEDLKAVIEKTGKDVEMLLKEKQYKIVLKYLLEDEGLGYGSRPKGVLKFHRYEEDGRTPFEEHVVEGVSYCMDKDGDVKIHFTVSEEHLELFQQLYSDAQKGFTRGNLKIGFSFQHPSTDQVAVDLDNNFFRQNGALLFRPGGHGALLKNLNELREDIVFIKNIDNVVPDRLKQDTLLHKKVLGGYLISIQNEIFTALQSLDNGCGAQEIEQIKMFCKNTLHFETDQDFKDVKIEEQRRILFDFLNRPIRVCGMVKNEGEPGGGPFWVEDKGRKYLQIIEKSQIDLENEKQREILEASTHFNPVDLVCSLKDFQGKRFDLTKFRDDQQGIIAKKSVDGHTIKAQELPGLWNGAMAYWTTLFVEVPLTTFDPVKTVNDLLRPRHQ